LTGVAALWVILSGTGARIVVGELMSFVTVVGVVLEVDSTGITPVFPLTPRSVAGVPTGTVLLCGPGGMLVPWDRWPGVGDGLLGYRCLGLECLL